MGIKFKFDAPQSRKSSSVSWAISRTSKCTHRKNWKKKKKKKERTNKLQNFLKIICCTQCKMRLEKKTFIILSNTQAIIGSSPEYIDFNVILNFVLKMKIWQVKSCSYWYTWPERMQLTSSETLWNADKLSWPIWHVLPFFTFSVIILCQFRNFLFPPL